MTDIYHPVTREELGEVIDLTEDMCLAKGWTNDVFPIAKKRMDLTTKILSRPDPLALLEAWRKYHIGDSRHLSLYEIDREDKFIKQLRIYPEAVRERGVREGWWKE